MGFGLISSDIKVTEKVKSSMIFDNSQLKDLDVLGGGMKESGLLTKQSEFPALIPVCFHTPELPEI